jgi:hypothetical protein
MSYPHLLGVDPPSIKAWAKRLIDALNSPTDYVAGLPIYADDAAAAAGGVKIGEGYKTAAGVVRWRAA